MYEKEQCLEEEERKQQVMDKRSKSLTKQSVASKGSKSGSKEWMAK